MLFNYFIRKKIKTLTNNLKSKMFIKHLKKTFIFMSLNFLII